MITLEPPFYSVAGATVLRDHEDPDQFYVLPQGVALARRDDGSASFTLYKYRKSLGDRAAADPTAAQGAGLALLEVETTAPPPAHLQTAVAEQSGRSGARVAPVVFRAATARALVAHAAGDHMVDALEAAHAVPLVAPHHAAFTLVATAEGATLLDQAARGGGLPVGVAYELRFLALQPAVHAHVTMDDDRSWDRFSASVGFTYVVSLKLDAEIAWLVENGAIHIEITQFTDDADAARQRELVMDLVRARVQGDFFKPGLPSSTDDAAAPTGPLAQYVGGASGGRTTSASAMFVLKARYDAVREHKTFELVLDGRTAVELVHAVSGRLATLTGAAAEGAPAPDIREIDLDDPFFATLDLKVIGAMDFDDLADLTEVAVNVAKGDRRQGFVFTRAAPGPFALRWPVDRPGDDEYQWDVRYGFDTDRGGGAASPTAGPFRARDRVLAVNPFDHVRYRRVRFVLGPVDAARVPRIAVRVRVPGPEGADDLYRDAFDLDAAHAEHLLRVHLPVEAPPIRVLVTASWQDAQGALHDGDEREATGDSYVVLGPFRDLLVVLVQPAADWTRLTQVLATLHYEDGEYVVERTYDFTPRQAAPQRWEVPLLDARRRGYRWRETVLRADGTDAQGPWGDADAPVVLAGTDRPPTGTLQVAWLGAPGDALGLQVDVWARRADGTEEQHAVLLQPGDGARQSVVLPRDDGGALRWRYELRKLTAAGAALLRSADGQGDLLVVQATG